MNKILNSPRNGQGYGTSRSSPRAKPWKDEVKEQPGPPISPFVFVFSGRKITEVRCGSKSRSPLKPLLDAEGTRSQVPSTS